MAASQKRQSLHKLDTMKPRKRIKFEKKPVKLDDMAWKDVAMPDRMEDYEGFFGLEELSDVEVIRNDANKTITYLAAGSNAGNEADNEDWSGFDEDEPSTAQQVEMNDKKVAISDKKIKPERKVRLDSKVNQQSTAKPDKFKPVNQTGTPVQALAALEEAPTVDISAWQSLKLSPDTLAALSRLGYSKPTRIQTSAVPVILSGADVIGKASTGSGKTLAFAIPILEQYLESRSGLTALILSPTRELAHQLNKHITALCSAIEGVSPSVVTVTGGLSLQKQRRQLQTANIIIATPGRLFEVISSEKGLGRSLKSIAFLVLDEADRLLGDGSFKELQDILNVLDREDDLAEDIDKAELDAVPSTTQEHQRQTLVFSATFDRSLQGKLNKTSTGKDGMEYLLSKLNFKGEPQFVDADPKRQLASGLTESMVECNALEKDLYLYLILLHNIKLRIIVFVNSISAVRRITPYLENLTLPALALHSGMVQKARLRSIERFTAKTSILVATDVAARGLDIPNVDIVIHYHLPRAADTYVHRSGRTARAGQQGSSILICSPDEVAGVRRLVAKVHASQDKAGYIRTLDPDRKIVARLKPRATLAKKLADINIAKEKQHKEDDFFQQAAEDLGIDYDSEEFTKQAPGRHGRGAGRMEKEKQARSVPKAEAAAMRAELKELLKTRINVGVSEKYITSGRVDVDELLREQETGRSGEFLGGGFMH